MTTALWQQPFDNSPRHCWPLRDGSRVRDGSSEPCVEAHAHDPHLVGNVSWRRFISAAVCASAEAGLPSPFTDDDLELTLSGVSPSLETYGRAGKIIATILVDSVQRTALISLFDPAYGPVFGAASDEVARQYRERQF